MRILHLVPIIKEQCSIHLFIGIRFKNIVSDVSFTSDIVSLITCVIGYTTSNLVGFLGFRSIFVFFIISLFILFFDAIII